MARQTQAAGKFAREAIQSSRIDNIHGMLFYGPPGAGKRSMAIQFGKLLNASETELINCASIMDTVMDQRNGIFGSNLNNGGGLRVVILDEIDILFEDKNPIRTRKFYARLDDLRASKSTRILIIGITSRVDRIPKDLLNLGRLEIQLEVTLPQIHGRIELLNVAQQKLEVLSLMQDCGEIDITDWQCLVSCFVLVTLSGWFLPALTRNNSKVVNASVRNNKSFYRLYSAIETSNQAW